MSDKFTHPDLRHLMADDKPNFPATPQTLDSFFLHHSHLTRGFSPAPPPPKFQPLQLVLTEPTGLLQFGCSDNSTATGDGGGSSTAANATVSSAPFLRRNKLVIDNEWCSPYGNDVVGGSNGFNSRWPRQETLTLLEIRSRLDSKFKESNQKGPLWDQVKFKLAHIKMLMAEEYGYKRSGKKCKEKFDNLYKYYKKTKEGKTGRHDGKHYRFFRQLEAIYGQSNDQISSPIIESNFYRNSVARSETPPPEKYPSTGGENHQEAGGGMSLSFTISSDFETSSSGNYHDDDLSAIAFMMNQKKAEKSRETNVSKRDQGGVSNNNNKGESWREEVEKMVDMKMSRLMEVQENWMEKIMSSVEDGEKERIMKEEEWRKQEMARFDHEMSEFCARERAWLHARELAFMEIVKKFADKG
ncbi:trihelix transcription factor PTL-like [Cucumis melo var. makuwa]|uniref:Trihelix transcription factor PTL-like n=1 Tax=Cucumis melo var. makuwa TaxID=1194695 RepID=A0A5D3CFY5_CUCMM|nr:trihelix transcription factor PTL-like [Cucumis melo var. makuwa]TYK09219.1 trihelix transcription factor PTL-like [Cucumis melo var. makuwa]